MAISPIQFHDDNEFMKKLPEIDQIEKQREELRLSRNPTDWLSGLTGLTGICAAHAFLTVRHVECCGDNDIPPLIEDKPSERMKYLEKLLLPSMVSALEPGQSLDELKFELAHRDSCERIIEEYHKRIASETGVALIEEHRQDFIDLNEGKLERTIKICQKNDLEHFLFVMYNEGTRIPEAHMVYVNFKKGIISDGFDGLIWKTDPHRIEFFSRVFSEYIIKTYNCKFKLFSVIPVRQGEASCISKVPLFVKKSILSAKLYLLKLTQSEKISKDPFFFQTGFRRFIIGLNPEEKFNFFNKCVIVERIEEIRMFLEEGENPNDEKYKEGYRLPLYSAIQSRNLDLVRLLLEHHADPNDERYEAGYRLPLYNSIQSEDLDLVRLLLERHADPNDERYEAGYSLPLCSAVEKGHLEITKLLLKYGANLNDERYEDGYSSPLYNSIKSGNLDLVRLLLEHGTDPNDRRYNRRGSLLQFIQERGESVPIEIIDLLRERLS